MQSFAVEHVWPWQLSPAQMSAQGCFGSRGGDGGEGTGDGGAVGGGGGGGGGDVGFG